MNARTPPRFASRIPMLLWRLQTAPDFDAAEPTHAGLRYREQAGKGRAPAADVYLPPGDGPHPSVVIVHGGGFLIGSRRMKPVRYLATRFVAAGLAVATFDYRLIFRGGRLHEASEDVCAMFSWWHAQAEAWGLDPARVSTLGMSAGATLTALHAGAAEEPLHRVVVLFGLQDFTRMTGAGPRMLRRLLLRTSDAETWREASPMTRCLTEAPVLVLHGDADTLVDVEHSRGLVDARQAQGLPTELEVYPGAPHGFFLEGDRPPAPEALDRILRFLEA